MKWITIVAAGGDRPTGAAAVGYCSRERAE